MSKKQDDGDDAASDGADTKRAEGKENAKHNSDEDGGGGSGSGDDGGGSASEEEYSDDPFLAEEDMPPWKKALLEMDKKAREAKLNKGKKKKRRKKKKKEEERMPLKVEKGELVEALLDDEWFPGKINKVRKDGTVDIMYDDGDLEEKVDPSRLRSQELLVVEEEEPEEELEEEVLDEEPETVLPPLTGAIKPGHLTPDQLEEGQSVVGGRWLPGRLSAARCVRGAIRGARAGTAAIAVLAFGSGLFQ